MAPREPVNNDEVTNITSNNNGVNVKKDIIDRSSSSSSSSPSVLLLKIDNVWYDLTQWQKCHPGGSEILRHLHGEDATDAFYSLHSSDALKRLKRVPQATPQVVKEHVIDDEPTEEISLKFRELRQELSDGGYFDRNIGWEVVYSMLPLMFAIVGIYYAQTSPILAIMFLGLGFQQAGWVGHDWAHSRTRVHRKIGWIWSAFFPGFSASWWSKKHNTHHVFTNYFGIDTDIANDPVFHIWVPLPEKDFYGRPFQHVYYIPLYSFLYASWRMQSLMFTWERGIWNEFVVLCLGYVWMFALLPWYVIVGSILWGGWLVAIIVTATHQSEEIFTEPEKHRHCFVTDQFRSTRNAYTWNPLVNYMWGGMQYQLEHHLFPTAPKYRYRQMMPIVKAWAERNGVEYLEDGAWEILLRNYYTLKKFALSDTKLREKED